MSVHGTAVPGVGQPLLSRNFALANASMHLYFFAFFSTFTALPLFLEGRPDWQIGVVVGIFGLPAFLARPLAGRAADRLGRRRVMVAGAALTTVCFALYGLSNNLALLLPLRLINGAVMSFYATANTTLIADVSPSARRGEAMAYFNVVNAVAQIYAPWAAILLAEHAGFEWYWVTTTAAMGGCVVFSALATETHRAAGSPGPLVSRSAFLPFAVFLTLTTGYSTLTAFLTPYGEGGAGDPGLWFMLFGVALLAVRVTAGRTADRRGRVQVIVPGALATASGFFILGLLDRPAFFYSSAVLAGAGFGAAHTALMALTIDRAGAHERGAAIALFLLSWDVGQALGTIPMGLLAGALGYGSVFTAGGAVALLGIPVLLRSIPGPERRPAAAGSG